MDIDLLSKMVKELILDRDEVALPGVGSFVAENVPASFSDKGYTINPPYRKLSFRQGRGKDDTSLIDFYASANGIDSEKASRIVGDYLSSMKETLKQKKVIVFPELGRLRATKENNFFFVADENLDIFPEGFGLEPVSLKTHQETEENVTEAIRGLEEILGPMAAPRAADKPAKEAPKKEKPAKKHRFARAVLWTVIVAAVALGAFVAGARLFPDFFDTLLYTPEELEIINY